MRRWLGIMFVTGSLAATGCGSSDDGGGTPDDTGVDDSTTPTDGGKDSGSDLGTDLGSDLGTDSPDTTPPADADAGPSAARTTPTNGSAVAIAKDDKAAIAVNRTAGSVSVFTVAFGGATPLTKTATLAVGGEPWDVVIGNDDDTAYVILRADQKVAKIKGLHGSAPTVDATSAKTGSEPTGIAISPTGAKLYVANWAEGTITVIKTSDMSVASTIDLNAALAGSTFLGTVTARPGLSHPRSLVVTNNGDTSDDDETIYVTEFFSQARLTGVPTDDSQFDQNRQGVVYRINAGTGAVGGLITIAPVADTGFKDSKGNAAGCIPNQLYSLALNKGDKQRLYVTSNCESPRGPTGPDAAFVAPGTATSNFKTQVFASVFVIDTASNAEVPAQGLVLSKKFSDLYDAKTIDDTSTDPTVLAKRRNPLIPNDIAFATGTNFAYVTAYGSDAVFRVAYNPDGTLKEVGGGTSGQNFINIGAPGTTGVTGGNLPVGIASANTGVSTVPFALAVNENSRNVSVIGFAAQDVIASLASEAAPAASDPGKYDAPVNTGKKFFVTGLGRWSLKGQGWNSCESCHPDGLTDNVTWYFGRGPRQTVSLDGTYDPKDGTKRRILNWTGIFDEVHDFELNTRGNSGGLGAIVWQNSAPPGADDRIVFDGSALAGAQKAPATRQDGLNGSTISMMPGGATTPPSVLPDWNNIDAFVKFIRAPKAPTNLDSTAVAAGKALLLANNCNGCHNGSQWTISRVFYTPNEANDNSVTPGGLMTTDYTAPTLFPAALNPPSSGGTRKAKLRLVNAAAPFLNAANDQINCILRDVGTYPATGTAGIGPTGGTAPKEVRQDMTTQAQGITGFNIPSLLGVVTGAPYFHGGNARTLEEAFSTTFATHYKAHSAIFVPTSTEIAQIVAFLSSIDETATKVDAPATLGFSADLCPATFP